MGQIAVPLAGEPDHDEAGAAARTVGTVAPGRLDGM